MCTPQVELLICPRNVNCTGQRKLCTCFCNVAISYIPCLVPELELEWKAVTQLTRLLPDKYTLAISRLSVCRSVHAWSGEAWERVNCGSWHAWLFRVSWFVRLLAAKRKQNDASTIDNRGTPLVTQAQCRKSSPRSTGMTRNRRLTTNKPRSEIALVLQYSVSYMYKQAPWSSRLAEPAKMHQFISR